MEEKKKRTPRKKAAPQLSFWRNQHTRTPDPGEINTGNSETLPNQTLPLKTLLDRFTRNQPIPLKEGVYLEEEAAEGLPDFEFMDEMDRLDYLRGLKEDLKTMRDRTPATNFTPEEANEIWDMFGEDTELMIGGKKYRAHQQIDLEDSIREVKEKEEKPKSPPPEDARPEESK